MDKVKGKGGEKWTSKMRGRFPGYSRARTGPAKGGIGERSSTQTHLQQQRHAPPRNVNGDGEKERKWEKKGREHAASEVPKISKSRPGLFTDITRQEHTLLVCT